MHGPQIPLEERFWGKVDFDGPVPERRPDLGGCWLWTASTVFGGYGQFHVTGQRKMERAHRVAFALWHGRWPALVLDHLCVNPPCVRPSHLEDVTRRENSIRGDGPAGTKSRQADCLRGHPLSGANLYRNTVSGTRMCRECMRERSRERRRAA